MLLLPLGALGYDVALVVLLLKIVNCKANRTVENEQRLALVEPAEGRHNVCMFLLLLTHTTEPLTPRHSLRPARHPYNTKDPPCLICGPFHPE
jgi:hypothetical protein